MTIYLLTGKNKSVQDRGIATRERILETAQAMIQQAGYNAVSFRDVSAAVKIKAASIHYYFPNKEDLVVALVERYRAAFTGGREALDGKALPPYEKLQKYVGVVKDAFRQTGRMCLCGVLAAEMSTLPEKVAASVRGFFSENEAWLSKALSEGRASGELQLPATPEKTAQALFASIEGALMSAWTFKDEKRINHVASLIFESLRAKP